MNDTQKEIEKCEKAIQENPERFKSFVGDRSWVKQIPPEKQDKPIGGRLENWYKNGAVVNGFIYEDPRNYFRDGEFIHTSYIVSIDTTKGYLETRNTIYMLGKPKEDLSKKV